MPSPPGGTASAARLLGVQGVQARDDAVGGRAELVVARARAERAELHLRAPPAPAQRGAPAPDARPGLNVSHKRVRAARTAARLRSPLDPPHALARTPSARSSAQQRVRANRPIG